MSPNIQLPVARGERIEQLQRQFARFYDPDPIKPYFLVSVPLRIAPLGAHSDHQGGIVTGLTINRYVFLLLQVIDFPRVSITSLNFEQSVSLLLDDDMKPVESDWANYLRGVIDVFREVQGPLKIGFNGILIGEMPIGGLSSSAAVTIAYLRALELANKVAVTMAEEIRYVSLVENSFLGLNNGILDQSCILTGKSNKLSVIDCASQQVTHALYGGCLTDWEILIVYSGLSRQLISTPFNQRVWECVQAARELFTLGDLPVPPKPRLGDISGDNFNRFEGLLPAVSQRRARHFFSEAQRVLTGIDAWSSGNIKSFGSLVSSSGESSIVNFESGSPALIALYQVLIGIQGVYGARFCGGGFQGCCLALVNPDFRDEISQAVHTRYVTRYPELSQLYSMHFCASADSVSVEVVR